MIRIEYSGSFHKGNKRVNDIPIKTVFTGTLGNATSVFMQTYQGVVDLASPNQTWERAINAEVKDYKEVDITIKVYDK